MDNTKIQMITAAEARKLVQESDENITRHLKRITDKVEEYAKLGKSSFYLDFALPYELNTYDVKDFPYHAPEFSPVQLLIKAGLEKLGYSVKIEEYISTGGGFKCMEENPEPVKTYHIKVQW